MHWHNWVQYHVFIMICMWLTACLRSSWLAGWVVDFVCCWSADQISITHWEKQQSERLNLSDILFIGFYGMVTSTVNISRCEYLAGRRTPPQYDSSSGEWTRRGETEQKNNGINIINSLVTHKIFMVIRFIAHLLVMLLLLLILLCACRFHSFRNHLAINWKRIIATTLMTM